MAHCQNCTNDICVSESLEKLEAEITDMRSRGLGRIPRLRDLIDQKIEKCKKIARGLTENDRHYVKSALLFVNHNPNDSDNPMLIRDVQRVVRDNTPMERTLAFSLEYPEVCTKECPHTQCSSWGKLEFQGQRCRNLPLTNEQLIAKASQTLEDTARTFDKFEKRLRTVESHVNLPSVEKMTEAEAKSMMKGNPFKYKSPILPEVEQDDRT